MIGINYPFTLDGYGRIKTSTDQKKIYLDRLTTLLSTMNGQRAMRPTYGTDLARGIYENGGDFYAGMSSAIRQAVARWLPLVGINEITINEPDSEGVATVEVSVTLPDLSEGSVTVVTAYLNPDGSITG